MRGGFETRLVLLHEIRQMITHFLRIYKMTNIEPGKKSCQEKEENCHFFENLDQCTGLLVRQIEFNQCFFIYTLG